MAYDEAVAERIREALAGERGVTEQKMFGGLGFMINGNMAAAAVSKGGLMVRVEPGEGRRLIEEGRANPMQMRGKQMSGWLLLDAATLDDDAFTEAVEWGAGYARTLPPK